MLRKSILIMTCIIAIGNNNKIWCQAILDSIALQEYSIRIKEILNYKTLIPEDTINSIMKNELSKYKSFSMKPLELGLNLNYNSEDSFSLNNAKLNADYSLMIGGEILKIPYQFELGSISSSSNKLNSLNNINFTLDVNEFKEKIIHTLNSQSIGIQSPLPKSQENQALTVFNFRDVIQRERNRIQQQKIDLEGELQHSNDTNLLIRKNQINRYQSSLDSLYEYHIQYKEKNSEKYQSISKTSTKYKSKVFSQYLKYKDQSSSNLQKTYSKIMIPLLKITERINIGRQYVNNSNHSSRYLPIKGINYEGKIGDFGIKLVLGTPGFRTNRLLSGTNLRTSNFGINFKGNYRYFEVSHSNSEALKQTLYLQIVKKDSVFNQESKNFNNKNAVVGYNIHADFEKFGKIRLDISRSELSANTGNLFNNFMKADSNLLSKICLHSEYDVSIIKILRPYIGFKWVGGNYQSWGNELLLTGMKEFKAGLKGTVKNRINYDLGVSRISPTHHSNPSSIRTFWNALFNYKINKYLRLILNARPGIIELSNPQAKNFNSIQAFYSATLNFNGKIKKYTLQSFLNYSNNKTTYEVRDTTNYNGSHYLTFNNYLSTRIMKFSLINQFIEFQGKLNTINSLDVTLMKKNYSIKLGIQKGSSYNLWRESYGYIFEVGVNTPTLNIFLSNLILAPNKELVSQYLWQANIGLKLNFYNFNKFTK